MFSNSATLASLFPGRPAATRSFPGTVPTFALGLAHCRRRSGSSCGLVGRICRPLIRAIYHVDNHEECIRVMMLKSPTVWMRSDVLLPKTFDMSLVCLWPVSLVVQAAVVGPIVRANHPLVSSVSNGVSSSTRWLTVITLWCFVPGRFSMAAVFIFDGTRMIAFLVQVTVLDSTPILLKNSVSMLPSPGALLTLSYKPSTGEDMEDSLVKMTVPAPVCNVSLAPQEAHSPAPAVSTPAQQNPIVAFEEEQGYFEAFTAAPKSEPARSRGQAKPRTTTTTTSTTRGSKSSTRRPRDPMAVLISEALAKEKTKKTRSVNKTSTKTSATKANPPQQRRKRAPSDLPTVPVDTLPLSTVQDDLSSPTAVPEGKADSLPGRDVPLIFHPALPLYNANILSVPVLETPDVPVPALGALEDGSGQAAETDEREVPNLQPPRANLVFIFDEERELFAAFTSAPRSEPAKPRGQFTSTRSIATRAAPPRSSSTRRPRDPMAVMIEEGLRKTKKTKPAKASTTTTSTTATSTRQRRPPPVVTAVENEFASPPIAILETKPESLGHLAIDLPPPVVEAQLQDTPSIESASLQPFLPALHEADLDPEGDGLGAVTDDSVVEVDLVAEMLVLGMEESVNEDRSGEGLNGEDGCGIDVFSGSMECAIVPPGFDISLGDTTTASTHNTSPRASSHAQHTARSSTQVALSGHRDDAFGPGFASHNSFVISSTPLPLQSATTFDNDKNEFNVLGDESLYKYNAEEVIYRFLMFPTKRRTPPILLPLLLILAAWLFGPMVHSLHDSVHATPNPTAFGAPSTRQAFPDASILLPAATALELPLPPSFVLDKARGISIPVLARPQHPSAF
ncbi:unnamed protein product [Mycena citricolor]|uniref:Uncharacterized protein n=1 Tax=Mycena citricolor TaxID=2018698 RepID=A0AAD2HFD2_9AGAR|nr:unnamed protein product [Mycena citricolor]